MPICRQCDKLIKPLGMPIGILERMEVELRQIISDVNYRFSDKPNYPVLVVPLIVEYCSNWWWDTHFPSIVVWGEPCVIVKEWTYHGPRGG